MTAAPAEEPRKAGRALSRGEELRARRTRRSRGCPWAPPRFNPAGSALGGKELEAGCGP